MSSDGKYTPRLNGPNLSQFSEDGVHIDSMWSMQRISEEYPGIMVPYTGGPKQQLNVRRPSEPETSARSIFEKPKDVLMYTIVDDRTGQKCAGKLEIEHCLNPSLDTYSKEKLNLIRAFTVPVKEDELGYTIHAFVSDRRLPSPYVEIAVPYSVLDMANNEDEDASYRKMVVTGQHLEFDDTRKKQRLDELRRIRGLKALQLDPRKTEDATFYYIQMSMQEQYENINRAHMIATGQKLERADGSLSGVESVIKFLNEIDNEEKNL